MQRHIDAIQSGRVTKTNVIGIRKAINHIARIENGWSGNRNNATADEVDTVESLLNSVRPIVTGDLHDSGVALLQSRRYAKRWTAWQSAAIASIDHFRLIGFERIGFRYQYCVPIYAVWAKTPAKGDALDGSSYHAFNFINVPWQSGGNGPEIV